MKARQYIHLGYQRLLGFEVDGGGFDWFGRTARSADSDCVRADGV